MDQSSLARLAPELRNNIYEQALVQKQPFVLKYDRKHGLRQSKEGCTSKNPLALAKACSGTHAEAIRMFYAINTFIIKASTSYDACYGLKELYTEIGPSNVAALRSVSIDIGEFSSNDLATQQFKKPLLEVVDVLRDETKRRPNCHFHVKLALTGGSKTLAAEIDMRNVNGSMTALSKAIEKNFKLFKNGFSTKT